MNLTIIDDVEISDKVELNEVTLSNADHLKVKSIILNIGEHGYAKIRYDHQTLVTLFNDF